MRDEIFLHQILQFTNIFKGPEQNHFFPAWRLKRYRVNDAGLRYATHAFYGFF